MTTTITLSLMALAHMLDTHQVLEAKATISAMSTDEVFANLQACRVSVCNTRTYSKLEDLLEDAYYAAFDAHFVANEQGN